MSEAQPALVVFLLSLRRSVKTLFFAVIIATFAIFFLTPQLLAILQDHLAEKLYFFTVSGPFLAHVKLAFFGALYLLMPWIIGVVLKAAGRPFGLTRKSWLGFVFFTCLLFYAGTVFCYFVTLPFGINFLLGFGSEELRPVISIGKFVTFVTVFILAFGVIFELPILMVFAGRTKMLSRQFFARNRKYALLLIAITAALLTPTPDIFNMALMGGPLYILYEFGIVILRLMRIE
jgi:sec-independent protein translocase protein TatC